jgi:hypothetical protein
VEGRSLQQPYGVYAGYTNNYQTQMHHRVSHTGSNFNNSRIAVHHYLRNDAQNRCHDKLLT